MQLKFSLTNERAKTWVNQDHPESVLYNSVSQVSAVVQRGVATAVFAVLYRILVFTNMHNVRG